MIQSTKISRENVENMLSLSHMQFGMLFDYINNPESGLYIEQLCLKLSGCLDPDIFRKAWKHVAETNTALRTVFRWKGIEKPVQIVQREFEIPIEFYDFMDKKDDNLSDSRECFLKSDWETGVDLEINPFRVSLLRINENEQEMVLTYHHILFDGWSNGILIKEFLNAYNAFSEGREIQRTVKGKYEDFIRWCLEQPKDRQKEYWFEYLKGFDKKTSLPYCSIGTDAFKAGKHVSIFPAELADSVVTFSTHNEITIATLMYCTWGILLQKYSDVDDVLFGTTISGRQSSIKNVENIVGLFINTIPLRINSNGDTKIFDLLKAVDKAVRDREEFGSTALVDIKSYSEVDKSSTLFDSIVIVENYPIDRMLTEKGPGLSIISYSIKEMTDFDLTVEVSMLTQNIRLALTYNSNAFEESSITNISRVFVDILKDIVENPFREFSEISIVKDSETKCILNEFNDTATPYEKGKTLFELFEEQVERTPDSIAVCFDMALGDVYNKVLAGKISPSLIKVLEDCVYSKNEYIHLFDSQNLFSNRNIVEKSEDLRMVKTNKGNIVVISTPVLSALKLFDGTSTLKQIYESLAMNEKNYIILRSKSDIIKDYFKWNKKIFNISKSFMDFIKLLIELDICNLLHIVGTDKLLTCSDSCCIEEYEAGNRENREIQTDIKAIAGQADPGDSIAPVLLLGDTTGTASTGILYLASYLRRNGIEAYCQWNDTTGTNEELKENIGELLRTIKPKLVGISMKWFPHIARSLEICKIVKEYDPGISVVIGGNTASYYWRELTGNKHVDYIILGDGELPLLKICQKAEYIPNCAYKINGKIVINEISYIQNEENSHDIYLSHMDKIFVRKEDPLYSQYFYIFTGKGCYANCFYCGGCRTAQKRTFGRVKPFLRRPEEVRKDISAVMGYTSTFMFDFEVAGSDTLEYYKSIWEGIDLKKHFCSFYFWTLPDKKVIRLISQTFKYVNLNIDLCSLSERHRNQLNEQGMVKPQPENEQILKFFNNCSEFDNIEVKINLIAGLPFFTVEDASESIHMLESILERYPFFKGLDWGKLHAQPGADLAESAVNYGLKSSARCFDDYLTYSKKNMKLKQYPDLSSINYPFIDFMDEKLNLEISKHYFDVNDRLKSYEERKHNKFITARFTYRELNEKANQLARHLRNAGVKRETIVGIMANSSIEMVIGIIGILKSGGAYLPIDAGYPDERLRNILEDSGADILLCQSHLISKIRTDVTTIDIDDCGLYKGDSNNLDKLNSENDLAYIIYTSGSMGKPKGVMVEHKSITNTIQWRKAEYSMNEEDAVLQLFSHCFDGFLTSFFTPIVSGAMVVLPDDIEVINLMRIKEHIVGKKITHFICVPTLYTAIQDYLSGNDMESLKVVTLAGEKVPAKLATKSLQKREDLELVNEYGPTENSVASTVFRNLQKAENILIGRPIANTRVYILNKYNQPMPIGVTGEICLSGDGVARGYLNRPELTQQKFVPDPFEQGKVMYKTGDSGKWLPDGNIEYIGRIDHQVKIRGFRIELGEIEARLIKHSSIKQAAVIDKENGDGSKYLCAYIAAEKELQISTLRSFLQEELPDYMVPTQFIFVDKLPFTQNGKLDRKALQEISGADRNAALYQPPDNSVETLVADIWKQVLDKDYFGRNDNFFDLGGNSILLMQVHAKLEKIYPGKVKITDLFDNSTVSKLAVLLTKDENHTDEKLTVGSINLPQDFRSNKNSSIPNSVFRIRFDDETANKLNAISHREKVDVYTIFIAAYVYLLSQAAGTEQVSVQVMCSPNRIVDMEIDISQVKNFSELYLLVCDRFKENNSDSYDVSDIDKFEIKNTDYSVCPLIYNKSLMTTDTGLFKKYDIILQYIKDTDGMTLSFEYNGGKILKNKALEMFNQYIELLELMCDK
ncbi:non-ribosomal peptide synthetase [Ruminiclostridium cellulolyticum]|uniref:Amino acid adenylation domain protein n=1 Tax=Ruminiclostridium cellulolyticum (strain ATCC 35319 / DSM 5812 / JCM 6584 / H10) TaxID=394503 RepID=B8I5I3_RUMCH|nr:non-ribosomal peptide synthetase [Ruminiclostridium cellulolyticum]ACL76719.1 amino acid adenylation domain protein [Ruminiclostridium cellulolyticum H10]